MKTLAILTALGVAICTPALAGGRSHNAINIGAGVSTGKGGLVGTLLGSNSRHGSTGIGAGVSVNTGRGGVLGTVLGSNSRHGSTGLGVGVAVNTGRGGVLGLLTGSGVGSRHGGW